MVNNSFQDAENVYFIGIGGISMSGLAMVLKNSGFNVSGSDSKPSEITKELTQKGIKVFIGQKAENIAENIDLAVYTAAISDENPELREIKRRGINIIPRSKLLGMIMERYKYSVAVAGTHGKTTTTSMISQILLNASLDPTISIGGIFPLIGGNIRIGNSDYFITEACEYTNSFLELAPTVAVILNVELDHIDYFKNMNEIYASFKGFASNVKENGAVAVYSGIDNYREVVGNKNVITFGFGADDDWRAGTPEQNGSFTEFELSFKNKPLGRVRLPLPGAHNVINTLGACAAAGFLGVPENVIFDTIEQFTGTKRRFEFKGTKRGFDVYDDYAHHPSEIKATLSAARQRFPNRRIRCVFQPHTYTRTKAFLDEFSKSFADADEIILADIYAAREQDPGDISSIMLMEKINMQGGRAYYYANLNDIAEYLGKSGSSGDIVITMGAGDINLVGETILKH